MGAIAMRIRARRARPAAQQMLDLIRRQGSGGAAFLPGVPLASGAHWLSGASSSPTPGVLGLDGVTRATIPWLAAYVESTASTPAAVDGPVGFLSDGEGTVGPNVAPALNTSNWTVSGGWSINNGNNTAANSGTSGWLTTVGSPMTVGNWYQVTFVSGSIASINAVFGGNFVTITAVAGSNTVYGQCTSNGQFSLQGGGPYSGIGSISVRPLTGRHATQNSGPNKPTMRRGLVNLLQNSVNLTASPWQQFNAAGALIATSGSSGAGYSTINLASNERIQQAQPSSAGQTRTLFVLLSGTGNVYLGITDEGGSYPGVYGSLITLTPTPTLYSLTRTHTDAAATYVSGRIFATGSAAATVTVSGSAMVSGAITAAQIQAVGGIPLTTTVAASSAGGNYALEFDGTKQMGLAAVPFAASDDHIVVVGARVDDVSGSRTLYAHSNASNHQLPWLYFNTAGKIVATWGDGTTYVTLTSPLSYTGQDVVVSIRRLGSTAVLRVNGTQVATASLAGMTSPALTTATLGGFNGSNLQHKGRIFGTLAFKGSFSDAELMVLDRGVASLCPIPSLRF